MSNSSEIPDESFDLEAQMREWQHGNQVISEMAAAVEAAQSAKTTRELAAAQVRIQERAIWRMFDVGISKGAILAGLIDAMPTIPREDVFAALEAVRQKRFRARKKLGVVAKGVPTSNATKTPKKAPLAPPNPLPITKPLEITNPADGSDRMPGESEADYQLRKSLEPSPPAKNRFIGEG